MDESKISVRYAKALLNLAKERGITEVVGMDLKTIQQLLLSSPRFTQLLMSPVIKKQEKRHFFQEVFLNQIDATTYSFLMLLLDNNREIYLADMVRDFLESLRKMTGIQEARLITAVALEPESVERFKILIRKYFNTEVELNLKVDPQIIGGFILQVEDQQIDTSIAMQLKKLKNELLIDQRLQTGIN